MAGHAKFREQRKRAFWGPRYEGAPNGRAALDVAFDHLRAALADLPDRQRDEAAGLLAAEIRAKAETVTLSDVHSELHSRDTQPGGPYASGATRARTRGSQLNKP